MAGRDYQKEYWDKIHNWTAKKRAEEKANENHSNFTIMSMVGFGLGVGLFYQTPHVILATVVFTAAGALLGAGIDYYLVRRKRKNRTMILSDKK